MASLSTLEDMLTCPVCYERYDFEGTKHLPKVLPCLHTLCLSCVRQMTVNQCITCPIDHKQHQCPDPARLDNDFRINQLLDVAREQGSIQPGDGQSLNVDREQEVLCKTSEGLDVQPADTDTFYAFNFRKEFLMASAPMHHTDDWVARAKVMHGLSKPTLLFLDHENSLHAVIGGRFFKKALSPKKACDDWKMQNKCIGTGGWAQFKFLFFDSSGELFAVTKSGKFYKGMPPKWENDNWIGRAVKIGDGNWEQFQFLFFHPHHAVLYGVFKDKFYKGAPPTHAKDNWIGRATCIGSGGWSSFRHLFFNSAGVLYGVDHIGRLFSALPPEYAQDNWLGRSTIKGTGGWEAFHFLFSSFS